VGAYCRGFGGRGGSSDWSCRGPTNHNSFSTNNFIAACSGEDSARWVCWPCLRGTGAVRVSSKAKIQPNMNHFSLLCLFLGVVKDHENMEVLQTARIMENVCIWFGVASKGCWCRSRL
jgi:hypothetical protein